MAKPDSIAAPPPSPTRSTRRPRHLDPPGDLAESPPVPDPEPMSEERRRELAEGPTRYGDWESKGIAIDF